MVSLAPRLRLNDQQNLAAFTIFVALTRARGSPPREGSSRGCGGSVEVAYSLCDLKGRIPRLGEGMPAIAELS